LGLDGEKKSRFMEVNGKNRASFVHADTPSNDIDFERLQVSLFLTERRKMSCLSKIVTPYFDELSALFYTQN
jgi:hypothetical protein